MTVEHLKGIVDQLVETIPDYPTRVLLNETYQLLHRQDELIVNLQGKLDGQAWNPSGWGASQERTR